MLCRLPPSNGRLLWTLAATAVGLLALPLPASAQRDDFGRRPAGPPSVAASTSDPGAYGASRGTPTTYIIELWDAITTAPASTATADPTAGGAIVCLAGCDPGPGTVVYRSSKTETAALAHLHPVTPTALTTAQTSTQPLACIAGCNEPPAGRTVASLRARQVAAAPTPRAKPAVVAAIGAQPSPPEAIPLVAPSPAPAQVKLRSGIKPNARARLAMRAKDKPKMAAKPEYGKIVHVPVTTTEKPADHVANTPVVAAATPANEPPTPPVSTFAPAPKPERRKPDNAKPVASASTDWFNKLKREQREADQARKQAQ